MVTSTFQEYQVISRSQWDSLDLLVPDSFARNSMGTFQFEENEAHNVSAVIYLPRRNAAIAANPPDEFDAEPEQPISNPALMGAEILVVDDEVEVAVAMQRMLEKLGFRSRIAIGAREAVQAITEKLPALVLSDVAMRGPNGITLAREMKSRYPDLPFVLISGDQRLNQGDTEFPLLPKPLTPQKLSAALFQALSKE
jgi:CheY-like chemotaxis protein